MTPKKPAPAGSGRSGRKFGELGELLISELLLYRCTGCSTVRALLRESAQSPDAISLGLQPCVSCGTIDSQELLSLEVEAGGGRRVGLWVIPRQLLHTA